MRNRADAFFQLFISVANRFSFFDKGILHTDVLLRWQQEEQGRCGAVRPLPGEDYLGSSLCICLDLSALSAVLSVWFTGYMSVSLSLIINDFRRQTVPLGNNGHGRLSGILAVSAGRERTAAMQDGGSPYCHMSPLGLYTPITLNWPMAAIEACALLYKYITMHYIENTIMCVCV